MSERNDDLEEHGTFRFERECRTPYSEAYTILQEDRVLGRLDLHFTGTVVQATLAIVESFTEGEIEELIEVVDEELVMTADTPREDFIVSVYQGRSLGTYSDSDFDADDGDGSDEEYENHNGR
jgi:hypothetical protein